MSHKLLRIYCEYFPKIDVSTWSIILTQLLLKVNQLADQVWRGSWHSYHYVTIVAAFRSLLSYILTKIIHLVDRYVNNSLSTISKLRIQKLGTGDHKREKRILQVLLPGVGVWPLADPGFSEKLHEIESIWTGGLGASLAVPLGSANVPY